MIILKNNKETLDVRLDRVEQFDERSRGFALFAFSKEKPKPIIQKGWKCDKYLNQGTEGACVGFGITHELIAEPNPVKRLTENFARKKIYWEAQKIDEWEGGAYPQAKPFYEGTSVLAGAKIVKSLGYIESYRWTFSLEELQQGICYEGPAVLGLPWFEGMANTDRNGYVYPTGRYVGGHCVMCNGINPHRGAFGIHNSWGKRWGKGGNCYIKFEDMAKLLKNGGEACFFTYK